MIWPAKSWRRSAERRQACIREHCNCRCEVNKPSTNESKEPVRNSFDSGLYLIAFADTNLDLEPWSWFILGGIGENFAWRLKEEWRYSPPRPTPCYFRFRAFLLRSALKKLAGKVSDGYRDRILEQLEELEHWETERLGKTGPTRQEFEGAVLASERIRFYVGEIARVQLETNPFFLLGRSLQQCANLADEKMLSETDAIRKLAIAANLVPNESFLNCTRLSNLRQFAAREKIRALELEVALNGFVMECDPENEAMSVNSLVEELEVMSETAEWWLRGLPRPGLLPQRNEMLKDTRLDPDGTFIYRGELWDAKLKKNSIVMKVILEAVVADQGVSDWIEINGHRYQKIKNACDHFNKTNNEAKGRFAYKRDGIIRQKVRIFFRS